MIQYRRNCLKHNIHPDNSLPSTAKRVVIYRFAYPPLEALVNPETYLSESAAEVITAEGTLQRVGYAEVKCICFASQPGPHNLFQSRNFFERRPKLAGIWVRFTFRDGDRLDGILPHNLLEWPAAGYLFVPPQAGALRQRVFIPKSAVQAAEVKGVVGAGASGVAPKLAPKPEEAQQLRMFDR